MPTTTHQVAGFADGICRVEIDVDNNNLRVRKGRIINDSDYPVFLEVFRAGVSEFSRTTSAHTTEARNLPASIKLTAVPQPNPDEDGPISMGDIRIYTRWPA